MEDIRDLMAIKRELKNASGMRIGVGAGLGQPPSGVYVISVASRMLKMHPQTLRKYERLGLVTPSRTLGMLRLYSEEDIGRLRMIRGLVEERRMNLAGVEIALNMANGLLEMQQRVRGLLRGEKKASLEEGLRELLNMLRFPTTLEGDHGRPHEPEERQ